MTVHQLHPQGQPMPMGWHNRLAACASEWDVVDVARDFVAQFSPYELSELPEHCRPGRIGGSADITEYAFALVRHRCDDGDGTTFVMHRLADFFSNAALRLSEILHASQGQEKRDDGRQSA